jgi:hypothetical protein
MFKEDLMNVPPDFEQEVVEELPIPESEVDKLEDIGRPEKIILDENFQVTEDVSKGAYVAYSVSEYKKVVAHFRKEKELEKLAKKLEEENVQYVTIINDQSKALATERALRQLQTELTNYKIRQTNELRNDVAWLKAETYFWKIVVIGGIVTAIVLAF